MDLFTFLGYVNKLSLVAFVITLAVIVYQIKQIRKEGKPKATDVSVPDFNENQKIARLNYSPLSPDLISVKNKRIDRSLVYLVIGTAVVVVFLFFSILTKTNKPVETTGDPLIKLTASKGIKILSVDWKELNGSQFESLKADDKIIVGIDKTPDSHVDGARIRINKSKWSQEDEKLEYNGKLNLYYRNHIISSDESYLKIEAQLHHKSDGWLGE